MHDQTNRPHLCKKMPMQLAKPKCAFFKGKTLVKIGVMFCYQTIIIIAMKVFKMLYV